MKVLITSSRMPFALDAIRKLGERGHEVYACDSYKAAPGSHSKYLAGHFTTASATGDPEQFVADVEKFAGENEIEVVIPMFEEIFYLAAQHERALGGDPALRAAVPHPGAGPRQGDLPGALRQARASGRRRRSSPTPRRS